MPLLEETSPASSIQAKVDDWENQPESPRLGRFVLGGELGHGGMGQVHLAWDPMLRRHLAIKRLLHADPFQSLRFLGEAQAQAKVEHPRICKVFEVGSEDNQPYIAMQFIQGITLGESRDKLSVREKAWLMAEVADAIHAAHHQGLIHRDLKPSNILLEGQGDGTWAPYILDFGLARDQQSADLTLSWGFVGTPAFMSPEQARAEEPTPASDVYSLGATFYALFAGHPPHEATTLVGLLAQQAKANVCPLRKAVPGLPKDLDTILLKCLESDPAKRYTTAFELEEDLRRWLAGEPIRARAIGPLGRGWRRVKRYKALSASIAAGLGLSLALVGWNVQAARRSRAQVELAQRFGLQVREVEQLLRIERMLPAHDIRPAEAMVRHRMEEVRSAMGRIGTVAMGPGHYALGRGHLTLQEFSFAHKELDEAWRIGFRSPEVAYALGETLMETYLAEAAKLDSSDVQGREALRVRYVVPALSFLKQAKGHVQEDPAFGEAQVAFLEKEFQRCIQMCREVFAAKPWMYEAKRLEGLAWHERARCQAGFSPSSPEASKSLSPQEGFAALENERQVLEEALRIAPSDERLYTQEVARLTGISVFQADSGTPEEGIFQRAEDFYGKALTIRPDDWDVRACRFYARVRHGFVLLRRGMDARPLMKESLALAAKEAPPIRVHLDGVLGNFNWILADGQYRLGEDPLPALKEMERYHPPGNIARIQPDVLRADYLASRGRDPRPALEEAERILRSHASICASDFYFFHLWGMLALARAEWEWDQGVDPLPSLLEAAKAEETSCRLNPNVVYSRFYLARIHALRALRALNRREDPDPSLQAALREAQAASKISTSHFGLFLTLGRIHYIRLLKLLGRGEAPASAAQEAHQALRQGLALNPSHFQLHLTGAQIDLAMARHALQNGHDPLVAIAGAEASARLGLTYKPDCAKLWLSLAQAQRLRAEWAQARGESAGHYVGEGLRFVQRALALHPTLPESLTEKAVLTKVTSSLAAEAPPTASH